MKTKISKNNSSAAIANLRNGFYSFTSILAKRYMQLGRFRLAETHLVSINSFIRFRNGKDISLKNLNNDIINEYEYWMKMTGLSSNTTSFYLRNLRSIYNKAVEKNLVKQNFPFRHVYTGVNRTVKRAITLNNIRKLKCLDMEGRHDLEFARDMFLFSFYTRGMSFIDMAYLRKSDLQHGILSYRRHKTGQLLHIRWEEPMMEIVRKYSCPESHYLLPIIPHPSTDTRKQYLNASHLINRKLKIIGGMLHLSQPLTMYVARHTWASIAKSKNIPVGTISEAMGHDSEKTTRIYLATLDTSAIDRANRAIIRAL